MHGLGDKWLVFVILVGLGLCGGHIAMGHTPKPWVWLRVSAFI